jgi:hypothetical protein
VELALAPLVISLFFLIFTTFAGLAYGGVPWVGYWVYYLLPIPLVRTLGRWTASTVVFDKDKPHLYFRHRCLTGRVIEQSDIAWAEIQSVATRRHVMQGMHTPSPIPSRTGLQNQRPVLSRAQSTWRTVANMKNGEAIGFGRVHESLPGALEELNRVSAYLGVPLEEEVPQGPTVGLLEPKQPPVWPQAAAVLSLLYCALPLILVGVMP